MVANYTCFYYTTELGKSPVEEFIDSLDSKTQTKFFFKKGLLEEFGPRLPQPHAKHIGNGIYELRFEGKEGAIRVLYFFHKNDIIFTNGFKKKTTKIPQREKALAIERRKLFLAERGG